jgi:molecular chaperone Hsp33
VASEALTGAGSESGELRRFLLEAQPLRGQWVRLGPAWQELRARHSYPPVLEALLGEAATAAVLLAATLKFAGTLTLQFSGSGRVRLLVAQCTDDFQLRAIAHHDLQAGESADFGTLVGAGRLAVTVQPDASVAQYQGIVPLEGRNLGECLERYFENSEQLPTRLKLAADATRAGGVLVQRLPGSANDSAGDPGSLQSAWQDLQSGLDALSPAELLELSAEEAVRRVSGTHDCRLFGVTPVRFGCRCNASRVAELVRSLGVEEARAALAEQGALTVICEFCGHAYRYDAVDVEQLFAAGGSVQHSPGRYN